MNDIPFVSPFGARRVIQTIRLGPKDIDRLVTHGSIVEADALQDYVVHISYDPTAEPRISPVVDLDALFFGSTGRQTYSPAEFLTRVGEVAIRVGADVETVRERALAAGLALSAKHPESGWPDGAIMTADLPRLLRGFRTGKAPQDSASAASTEEGDDSDGADDPKRIVGEVADADSAHPKTEAPPGAIDEILKEVSLGLQAMPGLANLDTVNARRTLIEEIVNGLRSAQALGPAMAASPATTSPQLARSLQATENVWRRLEVEFGLLSSGEVAALLGASPSNRNFASSRRAAHKIIGVRRGRGYRYPGFQIDREQGGILSVVEPLLKLAQVNGWSVESLTQWMLSPSTAFDLEDRPVDHLMEPEAVLSAAKLAMEAEW